MAHHKRHRPRRQRAGCTCGGKLAKKERSRATRGPAKVYGSCGSELRLRIRANDLGAA